MKNPEQQKKATYRSQIRKFVINGDLDGARATAERAGMTISDARLPLLYDHPSEPYFRALEDQGLVEPLAVKVVAVAAAPKVVAVAAAPKVAAPIEVMPASPKAELENGWPTELDVEVWSTCLNPQLVVVKLPDGRRVSLQKTRGLSYRIGDSVRAKLIKSTGDPLYVELPPKVVR